MQGADVDLVHREIRRVVAELGHFVGDRIRYLIVGIIASHELKEKRNVRPFGQVVRV